MREKNGLAHLGASGAAGASRSMPGGAEDEASNLDLQADFYESKGDHARANEIRADAARLRGRG